MSLVQAPVSLLSDASNGKVRCIDVHALGQDAIRLKRMGICEGRVLEVLATGNPMVLRISGTRVGLSRQLAELVHAEML